MFQQPWQYVIDVEDMAFRRADGRFKGLERDSTEVEREAFKCRIWSF